MLTFTLLVALTTAPLDAPDAPAVPPEAAAPAPDDASRRALSDWRRRRNALLFAGGGLLVGGGVAAAGWLDREGTFGNVSAVIGGVLGLGLFSAGLGALVTKLVQDLGPPPTDALSAGFGVVGDIVVQMLVAAIAGLSGMVAGGIIAGVTSSTPGVPRGVTGLVAGGLTAVTATAVAIAAW